jgi:hypothetical protein
MPQDAERLHAGSGGRVGADDHALQLLEFARDPQRVQSGELVAVVHDLDRALAALAQAGDLLERQRGVAAIDVADDVGVGLEHDVLVDVARARHRGPPVWMVEFMPYLRDHATIFFASSPALTEPSPISPSHFTPALGHLGEVFLDHALLDDRCAGMHLHAAGAEGVEAALRGDRERLEADDVLGTAGQMHLAGGDHRGDAAVEEGVDPAELALPRRPVAEHRVHVAVDQAGRDGAALGVDRHLRLIEIEIPGLADRGDAAVDGDDRVGIEDRPREIAGEQQPDIPDHQLAGRTRRSRDIRHRPPRAFRVSGDNPAYPPRAIKRCQLHPSYRASRDRRGELR